MDEMIKKIITESGIKTMPTKEKLEGIVSRMKDDEVETMDDLLLLNEEDLKEVFGLGKISIKKIMKYLSTKSVEEKVVEVTLPKLPSDISSLPIIQVSGNIELDIPRTINFIEFGIMELLNPKQIAMNLKQLIEQRIRELDKPIDKKLIEAFKIISKFNDIDKKLSEVLDFDVSRLSEREKLSNRIRSKMPIIVIDFINDMLDLRMELSDIHSYIYSSIAKGTASIGSVSSSQVISSAEEFVININKEVRGLNYLIIEKSLSLYKELFELINTDLIN